MWVVTRLHVWQLVTYMFIHAGVFHILFNMLALWMFGAELERIWGTRFFIKFYFVTGIGAASSRCSCRCCRLRRSRSCTHRTSSERRAPIYGLLLAYALYFPNRPIYMYFVFPIPAELFVLIMGGLAFYSSMSEDGGGVANATHLGGLLVA